MKNLLLSKIDSEDINDILIQIESSFNIRFFENELSHVTMFGELSDAILKKIDLKNITNCTSQQAFYKLRHSISVLKEANRKDISPTTNLSILFPRKDRRKEITKLENKLGFKLSILSPPMWLNGAFLILLLVSISILFFNWKIGILGIIVFTGCLFVAKDLGKELQVKTIGELAEKITRENYLNSRRDKNSYNKIEVRTLLLDWFKDKLTIDNSFKKQITSAS